MSERIAVFGAGVSGQAAVQLAKWHGAEVSLFDEKSEIFAPFDANARMMGWDRFVVSPGFAAGHPWRTFAQSSGQPCQSELAYAATHWRGKIIGVTGTNGKTSLTRLLAEALKNAGQIAYAVGNIGKPFAEVVASSANRPDAWAVCEISSFQAELADGLKLDALIWTNFAEDHLDRYVDSDTYFDAKANLFRYLRKNAVAIGGAALCRAYAEKLAGRLHSAPNRSHLADLAEKSPFASEPQSENFACAGALWESLGLPTNALIAAANEFQLDAHRCQRVGRFGGVVFWNDSKATNFHAVEAALPRMDTPVFWIGGGVSKGGDLDVFVRRVAPQIEEAFVYGAVAEQLGQAFVETGSPVQVFQRFEDAVEAASNRAMAVAPATVLMSPGFASFDQFLTYSQRGKSFISIVLSLMDRALTN